tara:strand:- start:674 stop:1045 length:372 start_codon:yes stop_codon:yes gene_type:complete
MCVEIKCFRRGRVMGRGNIKKLDWQILNVSLDQVLSEISVDEIWLEDLTCPVIDRYIMLSGHRVIHHNTYPKKRFQMAISTKKLLDKGWICKRRSRYHFLKIDGEKRRIKTRKMKAFRIGEEE